MRLISLVNIIELSIALTFSVMFISLTIERFDLLQHGLISYHLLTVILIIPVTVAVIFYLPKNILKEYHAYCAKFIGATENGFQTSQPNQSDQRELALTTVVMLTSCFGLLIIGCMTSSHLNLLPEAKILYLVFYFTLIAIALIDYSNFLIPEQITLPLILVGLVSSASNVLPIQLEESVYGLVLPGIFAVGIWIIQSVMKIAKVAKENPLIGTGDYYLLSACGVWFGLQNLGYVVCFMALFSFVFAILFRTRNIPLGVPILLAAITLFFKHA